MHRRRFCVLSIIGTLVLVSLAFSQAQTVYQEIALGKQALAKGKFDDAIEHFGNASNLAPDNPMVQLDLATALAEKYDPGAHTNDNDRIADQAIDHYQRVLENNSSRISSASAAKGLAFLMAQMNKFDEAKGYYQKAKQLNGRDPEVYFYTAVIDWTVSSQFRKQERAKAKLKPEDSLPAKDPSACNEVKGKNWNNLAEAIDNLNQALELRPDYEDAMNYMNLVYLERADIQCDDPAGGKADLKAADDWTQKLIALKKDKALHPKRKQADDDDE